MNRWIGLLVALFAARGVVLACVLPPGEMWDEYAHLAVVDHWAATGRPAVYGRTTVDPAFLAAVARLPQPPPVAFARTYGPFWAGSPPPPLPPTLGMYEAQHPSLYYALVAPVYRLCGGRSDLPAAVSVLRLLNLACGAAGVWLVLRWLGRTLDGPSAFVLGCWVTLQPLLLLDAVRVANDALAFLLGTAVVVTTLDLHRPGPARRAAALAVLLPMAVLTKATNATLLPVVAAAYGLAAVRGSVRPGVAAASVAVIVVGGDRVARAVRGVEPADLRAGDADAGGGGEPGRRPVGVGGDDRRPAAAVADVGRLVVGRQRAVGGRVELPAAAPTAGDRLRRPGVDRRRRGRGPLGGRCR